MRPKIGVNPSALKNMTQKLITAYGVQARNHTSKIVQAIFASLISICTCWKYNNWSSKEGMMIEILQFYLPQLYSRLWRTLLSILNIE